MRDIKIKGVQATNSSGLNSGSCLKLFLSPVPNFAFNRINVTYTSVCNEEAKFTFTRYGLFTSSMLTDILTNTIK